MISAGIKDVKNNLSRFLTRVKEGEEILITDRGKPVARIIKEKQGSKSVREALGDLAFKGMIVLPTRGILKKSFSPLKTKGKPASEMVIEDRR